MARDPDLYEKLANSIAPSIYGDYTVNIKKAIACLLIGGSRKRLPDGMIVRLHYISNAFVTVNLIIVFSFISYEEI